MRRQAAEIVVDFLSFSPSHAFPEKLRIIKPREWQRTAQWLDDSGLAFYFLHKLRQSNSTDSVPEWILSALENNLCANEQRTQLLRERLNLINTRFSEAGIRYAVLKGFSLVPGFCPSSSLRHQGDLDYLVDEGSLPAAQQALLSAGYTRKESRSSQEFIFINPGTQTASRSGRQYLPHAPHAVELHLDIWDSVLHGLPSLPGLFSPERTCLHQSQGLAFPALSDEDALLLQVLHASHHLFTHWIRMSCLYEISYFLNGRAADSELWDRVEQRVGSNTVLRELVVIIAKMAEQIFAAPIPPPVREWSIHLRRGPSVWIEHYAREWSFCEVPVYEFTLFPKSKLALFLHNQYRDTGSIELSTTQPSNNSGSRISRILASIRRDHSLIMNVRWWRQQLLLRRAVYHTLAGLRYLCETPRWKWRSRRTKATEPSIFSSKHSPESAGSWD